MLDELTSEEKKYIYPIIAVIILILIITLAIIWWPKSSKMLNKINVVNLYGDYSEIQLQKYENILKEYLLDSNFNNLYSKISNEWILENGFTSEEEVKNYLFKNYIISSTVPTIISSEVFSSDDLYIFKFIISSNGKEKNVYINETKPYEYTFSFEEHSINSISNKKYNYILSNVSYDIETKYASDSLVQYEIKATNNSTDTYTWMMKDANKVFLELDDGESIVAQDITSFGLVSVDLKPGGEFTQKLTFSVPLDKQSKIRGIRFENTYKNNYDNDIEIVLNGGGN